MEPVFIIAFGILNIIAQHRNYGIDVEKHPHLKDVRVRRQIDFQPYVFEDKHQNEKNTLDAIPEETFSMKSLLKGDRDIRVKRETNVYSGTTNTGKNGNNLGQIYINKLKNPVSYYAPAPPASQYGYINRMKRSYSYDQKNTQKPYVYSQMNAIENDRSTNKPYPNYVAPLSYNGYNSNNNGYNPINNVYNANNNGYPNNNGYYPNNNGYNAINNVYNANNNGYNPNNNGYNPNNNGYNYNNNEYNPTTNGYNSKVVEYNGYTANNDGYTQRYDNNSINKHDVTKTNTDINYNVPNSGYKKNYSYNSHNPLNNGTYITNSTVSAVNRTTSTAAPKINSAQFMVGFGCAGVLKYIKIGNTNLCVDKNEDDDFFID